MDLENWDSVVKNRVDLVERVTVQLREKVINGTLQQGTSLPSEAALAERMRDSRPVIREAMMAHIRETERLLVESERACDVV